MFLCLFEWIMDNREPTFCTLAHIIWAQERNHVAPLGGRVQHRTSPVWENDRDWYLHQWQTRGSTI